MKTINFFRSKLFALTLALMASVSSFAHDFSVNGIYYNILDSNALAVTKAPTQNSQYQGDIIIPSMVEYEGKTYIVREISKGAFSQNNINSVVLPDSLLYIRHRAFFNTPIDGHLIIPDKVVAIENYAFDSCHKLDSITIGKGVTEIGTESFSMMFSTLTTVIWNATNVTEVQYGLFPSSVTTVIFGDDVEHIHANICPINMTTIVFGKRTKSIAAYAFKNCTSLQEITIPDSVISIGEYAFFNTPSLNKIVWNAIAYPDIKDSFYSAFFDDYSGKITSFIFGESVRHIPAEICYKLSGVKSITIPESVETIGAGAFYRSGITNITIPDNVVSIGRYAFTSCPLQSVEIGKSIKYFGEYAFGECYFLVKTSYSGDIADWCDIYFSTIESNPAGYSYNLYVNDNALTELVIPSSVDTIKNFAFVGVNSLQKVSLGEDVKHIGYFTFGSCENIESIIIGKHVATIDTLAFYMCKNLKTVTCQASSVPQLGERVFESVPVSTATLYVPAESVEAYKTADQWKEFGQILPIEQNPEDLFPTLWGLQRTDVELHTTGDNELYRSTFNEYIHSVPYKKQRIYLTYDRQTYLREENNQVLLYAPSYGINEDIVLYDWTLEVGDTLQVGLYDEIERGKLFQVTDVSIVTLLDGKEYKKWTLACGIEYIEGIGAINGEGFGNYLCLQHTAHLATYIGSPLVCASRNGKLLYQMEDAEMDRLGAECLCDYDSGPRHDNAKNGKIGGRPTPTQWNMLEVETKEMDGTSIVLRAETFSYTLENDSIIANGKTFYQLARQSTKDTVTTKSFVGALHFGEDEDNRVYFLLDGVEYVLYDFTADPGDTLQLFAGINNYPQETTYSHVVRDKDTLENGACRMFLEVVFPDETNIGENTEKVWLAGLGSVDGIVHNATKQTRDAYAAPSRSARSSETHTSIMLCAWREDDCLYTTDHPEFDNIGCVYNVPTDNKDIAELETPRYKMIRDGHLYIIHNGGIYNVLGINIAR